MHAAEHNWLKDRRFWLFWIIQTIVLSIILVINVPPVIDATLINTGWEPNATYRLVFTTLALLYVFVPQVLTAALYKHRSFWALIGLVLLTLVYWYGFILAGTLRLVEMSGLTRFRGFVVAFTSIIVWMFFSQLSRLSFIIFIKILLHLSPLTMAVS